MKSSAGYRSEKELARRVSFMLEKLKVESTKGVAVGWFTTMLQGRIDIVPHLGVEGIALIKAIGDCDLKRSLEFSLSLKENGVKKTISLFGEGVFVRRIGSLSVTDLVTALTCCPDVARTAWMEIQRRLNEGIKVSLDAIQEVVKLITDPFVRGSVESFIRGALA